MKRLAFTVVVLMLAGCSPKDVPDVQWFKDHEAERNAVLESCGRDSVPTNLDCMNAQKAKNVLGLERRGYVKPKPVQFDSED